MLIKIIMCSNIDDDNNSPLTSMLIGPNTISFHPPAFPVLNCLRLQTPLYIFVFYTRDVQPLFLKGIELSLWVRPQGECLKMTSGLPKYLYYCVIIIIIAYIYVYIYIYLICKYGRLSDYTVRRAAICTAMRYIIEIRCEIHVTLRHKLLRLITLFTFRFDFSTVWDNSMWHIGP